jgi:plasmid replication initiation protein
MKKESLPKALRSKISKVYKNKKLNNANFGNFNHHDYQVFLHLVSKIGGVDEQGKYLQSEQLTREHVLTAKEFSEVFNVALANCYGILKRAVDKLMKTDISVEKTELNEVWRINVCSMAKYNKTEGSITIKFTDDIMPYLAQVRKKFVLYNLKEVANFGSLYTTRLYELIQEFKETGWLLKSVEQLREAFAVGQKFRAYKDFKLRTFGHACQEINDNYNMVLKFEEIKKGRKVVAIRFSFKPAVILSITDQKTGITKNIYKKPKLQSEKKKREPGLSKLSEVLENQLSFDNMRIKQK